MMMFSTYISVIFLNHFIILKNDGFTSISYGSDDNDDCSGLNSAPPPRNSHLPRTSEHDLLGNRIFAEGKG